MDNRYLFKAKRLDNGEWVKGALVYDDMDKLYRIITELDYSTGTCIRAGKAPRVDASTICQCTGLKDKNGKLIWENDIVNCLAEECCGYISWNENEAGFYFNVLLEDGKFEEEHVYDYQDCMEIIGNIFDNKELLESEENMKESEAVDKLKELKGGGIDA